MKIQLSDHFTFGRLLRFTLPSIAMMIFTSLYVLEDGFLLQTSLEKRLSPQSTSYIQCWIF